MTNSKEGGLSENKIETISIPCHNCGETEFTVILKGNALHRYICPKCKTPTYIFITKDYELIMFRDEELCPDCGGTGKCSNCKGVGEVVCEQCGGAGYYRVEDVEVYYYGCRVCGGGGRYKIGLLNGDVEFSKMTKVIKIGSGKVRCDKCNGTGICPSCMGYRRKTVHQ